MSRMKNEQSPTRLLWLLLLLFSFVVVVIVVVSGIGFSKSYGHHPNWCSLMTLVVVDGSLSFNHAVPRADVILLSVRPPVRLQHLSY